MKRVLVSILVCSAAVASCRSADESPPETVAVAFEEADAEDRRQVAMIQFADSITAADRQWVEDEGFEIVQEFAEHATMIVRVPDLYSGDPREENPRVIGFEVRQRRGS